MKDGQIAKAFYDRLREATRQAQELPGLEDRFLEACPELAPELETLKVAALRLLLAAALDEVDRLRYAPQDETEQWFHDLLQRVDIRVGKALGRPVTQEEKSAITHDLLDYIGQRYK